MISIAMATYNGEKFIREQLDSILAQTITDWELIVCDDVSTDSTIAIIEEYAKKDSRIQIHKNKVNLGFKRNFEKAIELCQGDYIALCDQDDIWYSNHLEVLYNQIGNHSLSIGNSDIVDENNLFCGHRMSETDYLTFLPTNCEKLIYRELLNSNPFQGAAMLLKKTFADTCIPIPDNVLFHDTWISACACAQEGIIYSYEPIIRYRQHQNNVTHHSGRQKKINKWKTYFSYIVKLINTVTNKHLSSTDRFEIAENLRVRYGGFNDDFVQISMFLENAKKQKLNINDVLFLWKNMEYITTSHSKRGFLRFWFLWSHMYPINNE